VFVLQIRLIKIEPNEREKKKSSIGGRNHCADPANNYHDANPCCSMKSKIEFSEFVLMVIFSGIAIYTGISLLKFMFKDGFNF